MDALATSFQQYVTEVREIIDGELLRYSQFTSDVPERLQDAIRYSLLAPGKRLRPLMVLSAAEACGSEKEAALPAACAIEMIHTYSLIHDDLPAMDDDELRRGRPTCHIKFDEATAILAGDGLLTLAFEVLSMDLKPAETATQCCTELARAAGVAGMVGGQVDDLAAEGSAGNLEQLQNIHRRKTAALLCASLRLGAICANANREQIERLQTYGENLGLAFQIVDDLLDLKGDTQTLGKNTGQDTHRGKLTYPSLLGETESCEKAHQLIDTAITSLKPFGEQANNLVALAQYVLNRDH